MTTPTKPDIQHLLRHLPSVDQLLQQPTAVSLSQTYGRSLLTSAIRHAIDANRHAILQGKTAVAHTAPQLLDVATAWLADLLSPTLRPVINATGVIIHTNLGRAPLSEAALTAVQAAGGSYTNLEYDLESGQRGSRSVHASTLLTRLTQAEAALVVNNNAAAVLLMLTALCQGKEVIISRGQLVEIGGGFRIPDVMAQSGATLIEVGTTNRTHLRDYADAITQNTAALLVAHHSNYKIVGFTSEPSLAELAALAQAHDLPLLYDQGSGALLDSAPYGLEPEPTVLDGLAAGCDVVAFSGDKLLGGPQAGILTGRADLLARITRHPLARAVRADKLALAALTATLQHYLTEQATTHIPVWRMIAQPLTAVKATAVAWQDHLQKHGISAETLPGHATVGGGSLPGTKLPTCLVAINHPQPDALAARLRALPVPIIGRIQDGRLVVDPRTVLPKDIEMMLQNLVHCVLV